MESMDENDRQETDSTSEKIDEREDFGYEEMVTLYDESMRHLSEGQIVTGRVITINPNHVVVDVGYKSEGLIPIAEFVDYEGNLSVEIGDDVEVLLERTEDAEGHVLLSKQKAERMMVWSDIEKSYKAGDIIHGRVIDRIKGGLTVDVGIRAFLPGLWSISSRSRTWNRFAARSSSSRSSAWTGGAIMWFFPARRCSRRSSPPRRLKPSPCSRRV